MVASHRRQIQTDQWLIFIKGVLPQTILGDFTELPSNRAITAAKNIVKQKIVR